MDSCIRNPALWLALASHCVLHPEHAERLSSGQWLKPENSKPAPPRVSYRCYQWSGWGGVWGEFEHCTIGTTFY